MSRNRYKKEADRHLPSPDHFPGSRKLEKVFLNEAGHDALHVLEILAEKFDIGGPIPYLTIRPAEPGREAAIVVRGTWKDRAKSTGVAADGLTEAQARSHPTARAELAKQAAEKLLRLQARHAPRTLRYSTMLHWWLTQRNSRLKPGSSRDDDRDGLRVEALVEWCQDRTLESHSRKIGDEFKDWFRRRLIAERAEIVGDWPAGGQDGTIQKYHYALAMALNEFADEYDVGVRVGFDKTKGRVDYEHRLASGLTWTDIVKVLFYCLGYVWYADGFAWEWVERDGKPPRQQLLRLTGRALADHLAFFTPVLRLTLLYALTGTRLQRNAKLGWERNDWRGWIDFDRGMIIRKGRLAVDFPHKPAKPSLLLPLALRIFRRWHKEDDAQRRREGWMTRETAAST